MKAIAYFKTSPNFWPEAYTMQNVLTAHIHSALIVGSVPDPNSIMCYELPAEIMTDNVRVPGGIDINPTDRKFASLLYPFCQLLRLRLVVGGSIASGPL